MTPLPPGWAERARKELGEDAAQVPLRVQELKDRLRDSGVKDICMDDAFCLMFLRARKFNVEKAVKLIRRYLEMRRRHPDVCRFAPPSQHRHYHDTKATTVLQDRTYLDSPILLVKIDRFDLSQITPMYVARQYYTLLEACIVDPLTQVAGVHLLIDLGGVSFKHVRMMTPSFVSTAVSLTQDSFPMRCRGVHIVNQPFGFEAIYALFKPFLSEKLRKKIRVHGSDWKALHQYLPPELLPDLYAGRQEGIDNGPWMQRLASVESALMARR